MRVLKETITSVGLTILAEPDDPHNAIIDIVFVSGLGGHPLRTWLHTTKVEPQLSPKSPSQGSLRGLLRKNSSLKSSSKIKIDFTEDPEKEKRTDNDVYWPLDLLPQICPNARIMTWGSYTIVSNSRMPRNQNDVFAHADELLSDLTTLRDETNTIGRSIIFITHSVGGVIVKEVLRRSEAENESHLKDILPSTAAIIFIGCPHRASEHAKLGDAVRIMASLTLGIDLLDPTLQEISGANSFELELGRESFIRLWNDYNFKVKTYQETEVTQGTTDSREDMCLRRESSFLGNPREQAEDINTGHLGMCKFKSADEPTFKSLSAAISKFVRDEAYRNHQLSQKEKECLRALIRPNLNPREYHAAASYPGTCLWLYDIPEFRAWHHRTNGTKNKLLWIKGGAGSGKSILLRSLRNRIEKQWAANGSSFIWCRADGESLDSVFFSEPRSQQVETNPANIYRSLLAQLFRQDPRLRKALLSMYKKNRLSGSSPPFDDAQVVLFFIDDYVDQRVETPTKRTFIFIDAAESCSVDYLRDLLHYLSRLVVNSDFSICVASSEHPDLNPESAISIKMEEHNMDDIQRFVNLNLLADWEDRNHFVGRLARKAGGLFLWAEIVLNILNGAIEEGTQREVIEDTLDDLPSDIEGLFEWMLNTLTEEEKAETLVLMQWVILASEPLRLNDLRLAVRLTQPALSIGKSKPYASLSVGPPTAIRDLRKPGSLSATNGATSGTSAFDTPYQFHRWLRGHSVGLLELRPEARGLDGTGGMGIIHEPLGLQRVQVIHESVRTFFLSGRGFACLAGPSVAQVGDFGDVSHFALINACLKYLNMTDFDSLGGAGIGGGILPVAPMPYEESKYWRRNVHDQRNLVVSSYPFLQYAVDSLLFHLLSPRLFRHFLPQRELVRCLSADRCRLWRRWTALLGESEPSAILRRCAIKGRGCEELLSPVYGARYRLERVFRKLNSLMAAEAAAASPTRLVSAPRTPKTPKTPGSTNREVAFFFSPRSSSNYMVRSNTASGTTAASSLVVKSPITPITPIIFSPPRTPKDKELVWIHLNASGFARA